MPAGLAENNCDTEHDLKTREEFFKVMLAGLKSRLLKKERLLKNLIQDQQKCIENIALLSEAETLKNNFHLLKKGLGTVEVFDYYQDPPLKRLIKLDPKLSPEQNLKHMFNLVKRAKRGLTHLQPRINEANEEILQLKNQVVALNEAGPEAINLEDVDVKTISSGKKKRLKRLPYRAFSSADGTPIWAGRSAKDNDELIKYFTRGNEWWLHAKGTRGSHVVIKSSADSLTLDILLDAAILAAHFSKLSGETMDVSYTRVKYVKKIKGMAVGAVSIQREKSLVIKIDPDRLARILNSELKPAS